jgi:hypothetical protein
MRIDIVKVHDITPCESNNKFLSTPEDPEWCIGCGLHESQHEWRCAQGHVFRKNLVTGYPEHPFPCSPSGESACDDEAWLCCPRPN